MGKRLAVIGANGRTGRLVVAEARARGHTVTALARRAEPTSRPDVSGLTTVVGDVTDRDAVASAVAGADAVIVVIGPTQGARDSHCAEGTRRVVDAMDAAGVRRLVCVTGAIIGQPRGDLGALYRALRATTPDEALADRRQQERAVAGSDLDWTLVRPPRLTDAARDGRIRAAEHLRLGALAHVSRSDLASFLVDQVEDRRFVRKGVTVRSA